MRNTVILMVLVVLMVLMDPDGTGAQIVRTSCVVYAQKMRCHGK